jgi:uncharacterized protein (DUF2062 family)
METPVTERGEPQGGWAKRVFSPLVSVFRQGTDPGAMAESIAMGTFLGILPLPGLNSILCAAVAVRRRLNMGVIQAVNWLMLPVQIALFLPLSRLGAAILGHQPLPLSVEEISSLLKAGAVAFFKAVGFSFIDATLAWCAIGLPACWVLLRVVRWVLERRKTRCPAP